MNLQNLMPLSQRRFWHYFVVISVIAIAYCSAAKFAVSTLRLGVEASPLWPAAGIALAALLLKGQRTWPGIALGAYLWCQSQVSWIMAIALAFGITLQAIVGAEILQQGGFHPSLKRLQDVLQLVILGAWVSPLVNATISTVIGYLGHTVEPQHWAENWWMLWLGDGMGILVVTPLILVAHDWISHWRGKGSFVVMRKLWGKRWHLGTHRRFTVMSQPPTSDKTNPEETIPFHIEALICLSLLCVISGFVFSSKPAVEMVQYPLEYLPFPLVVWAAMRFTQRGATAATLIVCTIALWGAVHGVGPFVAKASVKQAVLFLQGFMGVVSITALVLAAAESERARAVNLLKERETSLANAQRLAQLGNWDFYETCNGSSVPQQKLQWSDELYRLFGFIPKAFEPNWEIFFQVVHPDDREQVGQAIRTALRENKPYCLDYRIIRTDGSERMVYEQSEIYKGGIRGTVQDITERQRVATQLRVAAERDRLLGEMALRIRRSLNLDQILSTTVAEVREFLNADRVFIGQLNRTAQEMGCWSVSRWAGWPTGYPLQVECSRKNLRPSTPLQGLVIAESVDPCYPSLRSMIVEDEAMLEEWRSLFSQGRAIVVEDAKTVACSEKIATYHADYQVGAILGVPIWVGEQLYGALVVNQCSEPRDWQSWEIDWLTSLATQVAIAIQQAELYQQITNLAADLESQVEERTQELTDKMTELQELNELKDVFLQAVSHDLRTSLLGMSMVFNNLSKSTEATVTLSRPLLDRMMMSNERQLNLISALLEEHFHETRPLELHCQLLQLNQLIENLIVDCSPMLAQNQATLTRQLPQPCPAILADPTQLRRVLENLLTNALKHNPPGRNLTLQVSVENQNLRCCLQDDGVGMNQEQQDSLFKLYIRGLHTQHLTGIGLGLYQCRSLIEAHGGEIGVISEPNVGSTFWFTLPLAEQENQESGVRS